MKNCWNIHELYCWGLRNYCPGPLKFPFTDAVLLSSLVTTRKVLQPSARPSRRILRNKVHREEKCFLITCGSDTPSTFSTKAVSLVLITCMPCSSPAPATTITEVYRVDRGILALLPFSTVTISISIPSGIWNRKINIYVDKLKSVVLPNCLISPSFGPKQTILETRVCKRCIFTSKSQDLTEKERKRKDLDLRLMYV